MMITRKQSRSGIKVILDAMKRHESNADVQQCGCGALENLSTNVDNKKTIVRVISR